MTGVLPAGFPHSDIHGSLDICSSPWLFAAYHVFHRLSVPRHPPCALSCLTFVTTNVASFVGSVLIFWLENLILYEYSVSLQIVTFGETFVSDNMIVLSNNLLDWCLFIYWFFESTSNILRNIWFLIFYIQFSKYNIFAWLSECFHSFLVSHTNTKLFLCLYHWLSF